MAAPEIETWEEKTHLKGDTEACLEHGGCEGLEGHPEEGIRRCQGVVEAGDRWGK